MRLAYVVHKLPPWSLGGTEIHTWTLARALAQMGHEVSVFCPAVGARADEARTIREGVSLWRLPLPASREIEDPARQFWHTFRDTSVEGQFATFVATVDPEVVHFQHMQGVSARLPSMVSVPKVLTLHDYWYFCANGQLVRPDHTVCQTPGQAWACADCALCRVDLGRLRALRPLATLPLSWRNAYLRRRLAEIDLFISPSDFCKQQYVHRGLAEERIVVMENGLDAARLADRDDDTVALAPARPHFGFVGSLVWQKGAHVLVDAFDRLGAEGALTLYGDEAVAPEYVAALKARARHPHVRIAGRLDYQAVGHAMRAMDYLVVPSLWYENSPMVIQEAYAVGLPVVASRLGALVEKVRDRETGELFAPGGVEDLASVLRGLVDLPERRQRYRHNIRGGPTVGEQAERLLALYTGLVGTGRPR